MLGTHEASLLQQRADIEAQLAELIRKLNEETGVAIRALASTLKE